MRFSFGDELTKSGASGSADLHPLALLMHCGTFRKLRERSVVLALSVSLVSCMMGCGSEQDELSQWMEHQKRDAKSNVQPLSAPKKFNPQPYIALAGVEPFSSQKLTVALKQEARQPNSLMSVEVNRRKEPLEAFPLDSMSMVGSVIKAGRPYALLKVDNLLYQVQLGDHVGQNFGKITRISETDVSLREIVQDAAGEWIERSSALQLQEKAR